MKRWTLPALIDTRKILQVSVAISLCVTFSVLSRLPGIEQNGSDEGLLAPARQTSHVAPTPESDLLLSVPFYVYEDLAWLDATINGQPISCCDDMVPHPGVGGFSVKHMDDYFFMKAALRHPKRTHNPNEAKLFVIPILFNPFYENAQPTQNLTLCWNDMCNLELYEWAANQLKSYGYIDQYPERHIHVLSHWGHKYKGEREELHLPELMEHYLFNTNRISFENRNGSSSPDRAGYASYYVGNPCPIVERSQKLYNISLVTSLTRREKVYRERVQICNWLGVFRYSVKAVKRGRLDRDKFDFTSNSSQARHCGPGKMCPVLAESKFTFHLKGDTFGSQRLMDSILSGTVPVFTRMEQYDILPTWIDWDQLSYYLHFPSKNAMGDIFLQRLQTILDDDRYEQKYQALMAHRQLFNWSSLYPFDTYMYKLQADLYPETRRKQSTKWSALKLSQLNEPVRGRDGKLMG